MNLKDSFEYNPKTGQVSRKVGHKDGNGYVKIGHKGKPIYAHRIAWELYYGTPPKYTIDHINGDRSDNRIENLRDVPIEDNFRNRKKKPKYLPGVSYFPKCKKYRARITINKKVVCLGLFNTEEDAHREYIKAKIRRDS